jgi:hypothetical protein
MIDILSVAMMTCEGVQADKNRRCNQQVRVAYSEVIPTLFLFQQVKLLELLERPPPVVLWFPYILQYYFASSTFEQEKWDDNTHGRPVPSTPVLEIGIPSTTVPY